MIYQLFSLVAMYGLSYVGHFISVNSFPQFKAFCPSGSNILFHNAFVAKNSKKKIKNEHNNIEENIKYVLPRAYPF